MVKYKSWKIKDVCDVFYALSKWLNIHTSEAAGKISSLIPYLCKIRVKRNVTSCILQYIAKMTPLIPILEYGNYFSMKNEITPAISAGYLTVLQV